MCQTSDSAIVNCLIHQGERGPIQQADTISINGGRLPGSLSFDSGRGAPSAILATLRGVALPNQVSTTNPLGSGAGAHQ